MNTARTSELARSFVILGVAAALVFAGPAINQLCAESIPVPNGSFEGVYMPGSTTITADIGGGWTHGVGPGTSMDGTQKATYATDPPTEGTSVDVPHWINVPGWPPSYTWPVGCGSIAKQTTAPDGLHYYTANGSDWGNSQGGAIQSAAPLTTVGAGLDYTVSMLVNDNVLPIVLELLANDVPLTPTSTVDPGTPYSWTTVSKTYSAASLTGHLGESLKIRVGWGPNAVGAQSHLDLVSLDAIPEPSTLVLAVLGLLTLAWYGWRRRR